MDDTFDADSYFGSLTPQPPQPADAEAPQLQAAPTVSTGLEEAPFNPDDYFDELHQEQYGGLGQQAIAGAEALGRGLAGPLATGAETLLGVPKEDILARKEANPITAGVGEAAGLGVGLMTGTGMAGVMTKAGQVALEATNLARVAQEASLLTRVGSTAVQQAAEMAVLASGDETSKLLLSDPEASAESAIANIGMAAALGGIGGAAWTGAVSPLWKATAGPKVEGLLSGLTNHLNGAGVVLPGETEAAITKLGIETTPEIRAVLSGHAGAVERFNVLKEVQNKTITDGIEKLSKDSSDAVMRALKIDPVDIEVYSENEAGHKLLETFKKEFKERYEPIAERLAKRNADAAPMAVGDEARLKVYGNLLETAMEKVGTDSPYYKLYEEYGERILARDTIGKLDSLKTEINNRVKGLKVGGDYNTINALQDIKAKISEFQESQIAKSASKKDLEAAIRNEHMGLKGVDDSAKPVASALINERADTNRAYAEFANMSDELTNHLGIGSFHGAGALQGKLTDKISPEELLKKFSFRNNADFIQFLAKNFPETLKDVQSNELKSLLKPAILSSKGENPVNIKKLSDILAKGMAGQKEYIESVVPREAIDAVNAARMLQDSIPNPKSSGTAGWMTKVFSRMPQSATAAVAMLVGHNPVSGYLAGEMAQRLGRNAPDAINLAYLKFLGSNQPIKSEGFKAMVDFFNDTYKGHNLVSKAVSSVFKAGAQTLTSSQLPAKADLEKLDKLVSKLEAAPNQALANQSTGDTGYYLPDHQAGMTEASLRALTYLQTLKPRPYKPGPLDKEIEPPASDKARYNRALEIAQQPAIVLKHIKDGTLQDSDIKDLGTMFPGLYKQMASKLSDEMTKSVGDDGLIPYKTRMSLSLFLGQPLDTSMVPSSIMAAQLTYAQKPSEASQQGVTKKGTSALGKQTKSYQTPLQASETRKMNHK